MDRISVILDPQGNLASPWENGCAIQVFFRGELGWEEGESFQISFDWAKPALSLREDITRLAEKLGDAKILVGNMVSGLSYQIFDRMGFQVIEADCFSLRLLDQVLKEADEAGRRENDEDTIRKSAGPREMEITGQYFLDLIALQQKAPDISSKMALQPFFENTPFDQLGILCRHMPPWLTPYAAGKGWRVESRPAENGAESVTVFSGCCR